MPGIRTTEGLNAIAWTFTVAAVIMTLGRFAIHWRKNKRLSWDDHFNGIALIFLVGYVMTYQICMSIYENGITDPVLLLRANIANTVLFFTTIYAVKASFLALYWKIFELSRGFRVAWILVSIFTFTSFLATFLSMFWQCGSPKYFDDTERCKSAVPIKDPPVILMWCSLHIVGDLLLMIIPLALLSKMLMPIRQKIGVAMIFCLVLITIVLDILRTVFTLLDTPNTLWALLEPTIAVIIAALPSYGSLLTSTSKQQPFSSFLNTPQQTSAGDLESPRVAYNLEMPYISTRGPKHG
ncbi:unnamed protein product [Periconia digitata]|uniref:Rhodopsin domain-containing protein n=1 Tax=Periconia digitata TaxID=1303443 RepID=A0A9W4XPZ7_9PLEO|nr:unnamed protein product [Periconia digitata]